MADKSRGSIFYEILIVILVVALIAAILYPSRVWNREEELEKACHTRMEAINTLEQRFLFIDHAYTDSIPKLIDKVFADPKRVAALDTFINWDDIVTIRELKSMITRSGFVDDLRSQIINNLKNREPLNYLSRWDSLDYKLINMLDKKLAAADTTEDFKLIDEAVEWEKMIPEVVFWSIISEGSAPRRIARQTEAQIRRGTSVVKTRGWKYYRADFYRTLSEMIKEARRTDVWKPADKDKWEKEGRVVWEESMDTLSAADRDSIWNSIKKQIWEGEKELLWRDAKYNLWEQEKDKWIEENRDMWERVVSRYWKSYRRQRWLKDMNKKLRPLPREKRSTQEQIETEDTSSVMEEGSVDTTVAVVTADTVKQPEKKEAAIDSAWVFREIFNVKKDSLWRTVEDSIKEQEYERWKKKERKVVEDLIRNVWESDRRVSWEDETRDKWFEEKESDRESLWRLIKNELWRTAKITLWEEEQKKLASKGKTRRRIVNCVDWVAMFGEESIDSLVAGLNLPDGKRLWKEFEKLSKEGKKNKLYRLGILSILRDKIAESIGVCPYANVPYLIKAIQNSSGNYFRVDCPIIDTSKVKKAVMIDPETKDTVYVKLKLSTIEKLFGGAKIKKHGYIDMDGNKSWIKMER